MDPLRMTTTEARPSGKAPARTDNGWHYTPEHFPAGQHTPGSYPGQRADVYARHTRFFALDLDLYKPECAEAWEASVTRRHIGDREPYVRRGADSLRYLVYVPPGLDWWPVAGRMPWGDIRSAGLAPSPGSRHPDGDLYEAVPGPDAVQYPDGTVMRTNVITAGRVLIGVLEADGARSADDRDMATGDADLPDDDGRCSLVFAWLQNRDFSGATPRGSRANAAVNYLKQMDAEGHRVGGWIAEVIDALPATSEADFAAMWATAPVPADTVPQTWQCCDDAASVNGHGPVQPVQPSVSSEVAQVAQPAQGAALRLVAASSIKPERVRWLWDGKLKLGGLALLAGDVGLGKSTIAVDVAARLSRGTLPGEYAGTPQSVIICATEDEWEDTIAPRLMAAGADMERVFQLTTAVEYGANLMLPAQVPELAGLIGQSGARLVILDPLMSRLDSRLDSHKDAEVRRALEPLVRMAGDTGVIVLGLIHQNKSGDHSAVNRVMGSRAFTAVARSVLYAAPLLSRDPDGSTFVLATPKNNLGPRGVADAYRIEPVMLPVPGGIVTTRIRWLGRLESFFLDAELAEAGKQKTATAVDRAEKWLTAYLSGRGGRADSADVRKDGKAAGHSVATLKRAKVEAGVIVENTPTTPRRTIWVLSDYEGQAAQDSRARGVPEGGEPTEPTAPQESVCELTNPNYQREHGQFQSAQSAQVSGPPREAEPTDPDPGYCIARLPCPHCGGVTSHLVQ